MRVLVPFVVGMLHPRTVPAVEAQGFRPMLRVVGEDRPYRQLLADELDGRDDVVVVEQDVESRPGFLADLQLCRGDYCWNPYPLSVPFGEAMAGAAWGPLGHTKLSRLAQRTLGELFSSEPWQGRDDWRGLDKLIGTFLLSRGLASHRHPGTVLHHKEYRRA